MIRKAGLLFAVSILASTACFADIITLVTSPAALGANDTVTWSQLGPDTTTIPNSFAATSTAGKGVTGGFSVSTGTVMVAGTDWTPVSGDFSTGDFLIWANDGTAGTGPVTFSFPSGFGAGAAIQADAPGQFTAKIELFNGATSLGFETRTSDAAGDAIFIGALDTLPNVTKAVFSMTAAPSNGVPNSIGDFALDTLYLQNQETAPVPEPNSVFFAGVAAVALGYRLRRARRLA